MVLSGSKRTTYISSLVNKNQGGGSKKSGFPPMIGRDSWTSIYYASTDPIGGHCCKLKDASKNRFKLFPSQNLPTGMDSRIKMR